VRQVFLLTVASTVLICLAGALPFAFSKLSLSPVDAVFEAVSGLTTTGATVLRGLDQAPPGILLWRALLQWLGGAGFLILAVAVLPALKIGGMEVFRLEAVGAGERAMPRVAKVVGSIVGIYLFLTVLFTLLLWLAGMSRFPALLHALTTVSCGGFSTSDASVGTWHNAAVDWTILLGMACGGAPFMVHLQLAQGRWRTALRNTQLRWYLTILAAATLVITFWLLFCTDVKPLPAVRHAAFTVVSIMTGTGFATLDWAQWWGLPVAILFFLTLLGGCAGSTAGGFKVFRLQILVVNARTQMARLVQPHAVLLAQYEGKPVADPVAESVLGFLFVYILSFAALAIALGILGLDFVSAVSASASALANLGPGLSPAIGPLAGYAALPDAAKWLLAGGMLFGRLEMFLILALFARTFWEQ
jgi:trk system potassium uptake protein TrkH